MTRLVDQLPNERVTALDTQLRQRFAAENVDRALRLSRRRKPVVGRAKNGNFTTDLEVDTQALGTVLGGLEVTTNTAFSVTVSPGAMIAAHTAQTLTRPGTWSGNVDPDDDPVAGLYVLTRPVNVQPSSVPVAIASAEWWAVVAAPAVAALESDSAREVFNPTTGVFDAASAQKVVHRTLAITVVRGAGGGTVATVSIPAGGVVIAWLYVHAVGETNLNNALLYDARRMPDAVAPNRIGGHWTARGQAITGEWNATLLGEELSFRAAASSLGDTTLPFAQIAEPGATWPGGGGIAYLYLARVRGTVPRLLGTLEETDFLAEFSSFEVAGALVLSPTPPEIVPAETVAGSGAGRERFDMRNASTLTLPNPTHTPGVPPLVLAMKFGGTVAAGEALCVGFFYYNALLSGLPVTPNDGVAAHNDVTCGADGWCSGDGTRLGFSAIASPVVTPNVSTATPEVVWTVGTTGGKPVPVAGLQFNLALQSTETNAVAYTIVQRFFDETNLRPPSLVPAAAQPSFGNLSRYDLVHPTRLERLPSSPVVRARWSVLSNDIPPIAYFNTTTSRFGYRLPYGDALFTPR
jgi:hypothetical protein